MASQGTWQESNSSILGLQAGAGVRGKGGMLYWQVARCHSQRRTPWLKRLLWAPLIEQLSSC